MYCIRSNTEDYLNDLWILFSVNESIVGPLPVNFSFCSIPKTKQPKTELDQIQMYTVHVYVRIICVYRENQVQLLRHPVSE